MLGPVLGDLDVGGEGRAAERPEVDRDDLVLGDAGTLRDAFRSVEFGGVPLPVAEAEGVDFEAIARRNYVLLCAAATVLMGLVVLFAVLVLG